MIYKYCRRCGKLLKGDENRLRGYGKTCFEKAQKEAEGMNPLIALTKSAQQITKQTQNEEHSPTKGTPQSNGKITKRKIF